MIVTYREEKKEKKGKKVIFVEERTGKTRPPYICNET